jgi:hypothetical protein
VGACGSTVLDCAGLWEVGGGGREAASGREDFLFSRDFIR